MQHRIIHTSVSLFHKLYSYRTVIVTVMLLVILMMALAMPGAVMACGIGSSGSSGGGC